MAHRKYPVEYPIDVLARRIERLCSGVGMGVARVAFMFEARAT